MPPSHGEIKLGVLDFLLFSELAILVWFSTLTLKPFQSVRKSYIPKENDGTRKIYFKVSSSSKLIYGEDYVSCWIPTLIHSQKKSSGCVYI